MPTYRRSLATFVLSTLAVAMAASASLAQTDAPKASAEAEKAQPEKAQPEKSESKAESKKGNPQIPRTGALHPEYNPALPTVILIGDSTVKNSWDAGSDGLWGWGRPLAAYFDTSKINVENQALGGTSSRSYYTTGHWERVSKLIKPGDFVIVQFGHNDGAAGRGSIRGNSEETRDEDVKGTSETVHSYGWYIRQFIAETKAKGATPIVCSLIPRNNWKDDKVNRGTGSYATWAGEAAKQTDTAFIDLNGIIADHYDKLGKDAVKPLFGAKDGTHTGWKGAILNAECVVEGIKGLSDCKLKDYLRETPAPLVKPSTDPTDG
jgi:lysophospholipase L1-like esterase